MKTIKEWLETLPEPYRSQALECITFKPYVAPDSQEPSLYHALRFGFVWEDSPQGDIYWRAICEEARSFGTVKAPEADCATLTSTPEQSQPAAPAYKPFDLEAAKAGKPVMMRNGTPVKRILAFDWAAPGYPILVSYLDERGIERVAEYTIKGEFNLHGACDGRGESDLVMPPEKVTVWVNLYQNGRGAITTGGVYPCEATAKEKPSTKLKSYVGTYPIEITL